MPKLDHDEVEEFLTELFCEVASIVEKARGVKITVSPQERTYIVNHITCGEPDTGSPEWWHIYRLFYTERRGWHRDIARSIGAFTNGGKACRNVKPARAKASSKR